MATRRLIEAAATLGPADRALLNVWITSGLDDHEIAELSGVPSTALVARRDRLVSRLAAELGLPGSDVRTALLELAAQNADVAPAPTASAVRPPATTPVTTSTTTTAASTTTTARSGTPAMAASEPVPRRPRRRRRTLALVAALAAVLVAVLLVLALGTSGHDGARRVAARGSATTVPAATRTATTTPGPPVGARLDQRFTALAGVTTQMRGWVGLIASRGAHGRRLALSVAVAATPAAGHDEAWWFNSILASRPIAVLRRGTDLVTAPLIREACRYRWIDISFQPVGVVNPSGESLIRAGDPVYRRCGVASRG